MKIFYFVLIIIALLGNSCESITSNDKSQNLKHQTNHIAPDTIYSIEGRESKSMDWDVLPRLKTKTWRTKAVSEDIINISTEREITYQTSSTLVDTMNVRSYSFEEIEAKIEILKVPKVGYLIQNNDTIYAPEKTIMGKPKGIRTKMAIEAHATRDIQYLNLEQGMPSSRVYKGLLDTLGFLWFATNGSGIVQFDGDVLKNYDETHGLSSNFIQSLYEDRKGNLWMGTQEGGIMKYDGVHVWNYSKKQGFPDSIEGITEDKMGNLWLGSEAGFIKFNNTDDHSKYDTLTLYKSLKGIESKTVRSILADSNNTIWIGTEKGLYNLSNERLNEFKFGLNEISTITEDTSGKIWIGSEQNGLMTYDGKKVQRFFDQNNQLNNMIKSLSIDDVGNINIGTQSIGLILYNHEKFTVINEDDGLTSNLITSITQDASGNKWLSTWTGGICRIGSNSFKKIPRLKDGIKSSVYVINEDSQNTIWIGDDMSYLYAIKKNGSKRIKLNNGYEDNIISAISFDSNNKPWFASYRNDVISKLGGAFFEHHKLFPENENREVLYSFKDSKDILWFSVYTNGIVRYDGTEFVHYKLFDNTYDDAVYRILEDKSGTVFFINYRSILVLKGNSLMKFDTEERYVTSATVSSDNSIWMGTDKGPVRLILDPTKSQLKYFSYHNQQNTLSRMILSVNESSDGRIWMGTASKGLHVFNKTSDTSAELSILSKEDGFTGVGVIDGASFLDSKNRLWLGTRKGLSYLNTSSNAFNATKPNVYLSGITVNDKVLEAENLSSYDTSFNLGLTSNGALEAKETTPFFNIPKKLELRHDFNHLTFNFGGIEWKAPHDLKFQYKLDGSDKKWSNLTRNNLADYRNIPYGEYTFKVRVLGKSEEFSSTTEYEFSILPPWWHTWWARIGYVFLGAAVLWSAFQLRVSNVKKKTEKLYELKLLKKINLEEGKHLEKARLAKELHDGVLGSLFGIRLALDRLNQVESDPNKKERERYIQKISRLEKEVRSLSHGLSPHLAISDLAFSQVIQNLLEDQQATYKLKCSFMNDPDISWRNISTDVKFNLYRVVQESLQNINKHSKASEVSISFMKMEGNLELIISDNGLGFQSGHLSSGIGLKNITSRIKRLNGTVKFNNRPKKGVDVIVNVPIS